MRKPATILPPKFLLKNLKNYPTPLDFGSVFSYYFVNYQKIHARAGICREQDQENRSGTGWRYWRLRRCLGKHLDRYISEFAGRHNIRGRDIIDQMCIMVHSMGGKRLTYHHLIAENGLSNFVRPIEWEGKTGGPGRKSRPLLNLVPCLPPTSRARLNSKNHRYAGTNRRTSAKTVL